jgi:hypothetical protein
MRMFMYFGVMMLVEMLYTCICTYCAHVYVFWCNDVDENALMHALCAVYVCLYDDVGYNAGNAHVLPRIDLVSMG